MPDKIEKAFKHMVSVNLKKYLKAYLYKKNLHMQVLFIMLRCGLYFKIYSKFAFLPQYITDAKKI